MDKKTLSTDVKKPYFEAMAGVDHAWLRMDSTVNPMVINAVLTFKTRLAHQTFVHKITSQFLQIPRFRCTVTPGPFGDHWHEATIDEDYHFPLITDAIDSEAELQHVATQFINKPLSSGRPLWRMLFIEQFNAGVAVVVRIHHAYADGMALINVLMQLMDEGPLIQKFTKQKENTTGTGTLNRWRKTLQPFLPGNIKWLESFNLVEELTTELLKMGLSPGEENVFKTPGLSGKKQLVWTPPLKLSEVKTIAKTHHAKVNDILISSVAGAFRRYLANLNQLSSWSELRTVVPVDLRSKVRSKTLGNYFGLVFLSLPLGIEDPIARAAHCTSA